MNWLSIDLIKRNNNSMNTSFGRHSIFQWGLIFLSCLLLIACEDKSTEAQLIHNKVSSVETTLSKVAEKTTSTKDSSPSLSLLAADDSTSEGSQVPQYDYSQVDFEILDFAERDYKGRRSLALVLSVPLDKTKDFQNFLVLERKDGERVDGAWILSEDAKELFFTNIDPEQDYLLTVYANLKAMNQATLGERFKKTITTKAIEASVSFAHEGGILPLSQSKGLPIYSVNVPHIDIEFHRVDHDEMLSFLQQWRQGGKKSMYQLQNFTEQSEFVYSARFDFAIEKNKRERIILPIDTIKELAPAGIYIAVMKIPGQYEYRQAVTYFIRTDIGLHVRRYPGQLDVYTRSLVTGKRLSDVEVSLLDDKNHILGTANADAQGKLSFSNHLKKARLLLAHKGEQLSLVRLNSPALDLSEFNVGKRTANQNEAFIYAPRDLYRPGEMLDVSLLLRNYDAKMIPAIPLKATIKQEGGQIVERFTWQPQKHGYYHYQYTISDNAKTGLWSVEVKLPGNKLPQQWFFSVEDFLPERMKLTLKERPEGVFVKADEALTIAVEGVYLYGAPAAGNRLETSINTYIHQTAIDSLPGYLFGLAEEEDARQSYDLDEVTLDDKGLFDLEIPSQWRGLQSPIRIRVISSLFETGGRAVKRQANFTLWPNKTMIGVRPHSDEPEENSLAKFDVVNSDSTGKLYPAHKLQVTLIKKRHDYFWFYDDSDEWQMDYSEKQYPVFKQSLTIEQAEKALIEVPVEWGDYRLEIYNPETKLTNSVEFTAGSGWYSDNEQARIARPDKVNLVLDKPSYKAGDMAHLTIKAPFSGSGIILVENNQGALLTQEVTLAGGNEVSLDIPIKNNWDSHDLYISAVIFNQATAKNNPEQLIKRAIGLVHLALDRNNRHLDLTIDTVAKSRPFMPLDVTLKLASPPKNNTEVMVTLAAVDVGVLNVSNFKTPDPFSWFFAQRRYDVDSLDIYGNIMDGRKGLIGKQRFGGDMDMASAGNLQKADKKIVSLFHQPVSFNKQGEADIKLDIPDFNGTLKLMVVAFDEDSYGHAEQEVIIVAPIVTQLSMPRFLAADDKAVLSLDVHNLSDKAQTMTIELDGGNEIEINKATRQLSLADKEKQTLNFVINAQQRFGLSTIKLHLVNNDKTDVIDLQRQWQLAVRPAWPATQRNQQVIINPDQLVSLKLKTDDLLPETLSGDVVISNQPPINLASHLSHLLKYPYGCLEQTTSSSFPWLFATQNKMQLLGLKDLKIKDKAIDFSKKDMYLLKGVKRIAAKQLGNGGFGLWSNQSSEETWLSVYATHFLLQAKAQGIDVPSSVLKPALKRLQHYVRSTRADYNYRYSQYPAHLTLAYKAYAAYVLSSIKQASLGSIRTLYDYHKKDTRSGLPLMHLGIALSQQGDLKRGRYAIEESLAITRDPHQYLGDYGSTLRDLSLMLHALVTFDPKHEGIAGLLAHLQVELGKRQWLSTQERNALFMVGVALKEQGHKQWQAILTTALHDLDLEQETDFKTILNAQEVSDEVKVTSLTPDRLYASLEIGGYRQQAPKPDFSHFNITRTYYNTKGEVILPNNVPVGDLIIVELSLQVKNRIQDALVVDLLPAGFELENQNLEHSIKLDDYRIGNEALIDRISSNNIKYQAWRDDRYIAAVDLHTYNTQYLYYLIRAVTPGTYQVPPPYAEDMYRPYIRAIGISPEPQTIINTNQHATMATKM